MVDDNLGLVRFVSDGAVTKAIMRNTLGALLLDEMRCGMCLSWLGRHTVKHNQCMCPMAKCSPS